ncbi:MAG: hypothetical protein ACR2F0_06180, partial [Chthoniobacterales bacterium]
MKLPPLGNALYLLFVADAATRSPCEIEAICVLKSCFRWMAWMCDGRSASIRKRGYVIDPRKTLVVEGFDTRN